MLDWLKELALWIPAGIAVVGLVLIYTGFHRLENRLKYVGLGVLAFAVVLGLLSWFLETDREIALRQTRQAVKAVEKRDWDTVARFLHPDALVVVEGRDRIIAFAREAASRYDVGRIRILSINAEKPPKGDPTVVVTMRILADAEGVATPPIDWQLEWEREGDAVLLRTGKPSFNVGIIESVLPK